MVCTRTVILICLTAKWFTSISTEARWHSTAWQANAMQCRTARRQYESQEVEYHRNRCKWRSDQSWFNDCSMCYVAVGYLWVIINGSYVVTVGHICVAQSNMGSLFGAATAAAWCDVYTKFNLACYHIFEQMKIVLAAFININTHRRYIELMSMKLETRSTSVNKVNRMKWAWEQGQLTKLNVGCNFVTNTWGQQFSLCI